jgi:N-methylhydantoinase A
MEDSPIEAISWRLACAAPGQDIRLVQLHKPNGGGVTSARRGTRDVLFEGLGTLPCAVYDRYALGPGATFEGPALVEERESTCCVGPRARVQVDEFLNLVIEVAQVEAAS